MAALGDIVKFTLTVESALLDRPAIVMDAMGDTLQLMVFVDGLADSTGLEENEKIENQPAVGGNNVPVKCVMRSSVSKNLTQTAGCWRPLDARESRFLNAQWDFDSKSHCAFKPLI